MGRQARRVQRRDIALDQIIAAKIFPVDSAFLRIEIIRQNTAPRITQAQTGHAAASEELHECKTRVRQCECFPLLPHSRRNYPHTHGRAPHSRHNRRVFALFQALILLFS